MNKREKEQMIVAVKNELRDRGIRMDFEYDKAELADVIAAGVSVCDAADAVEVYWAEEITEAE